MMLARILAAETVRAGHVILRSPAETTMSLGFVAVLLALMLAGSSMAGFPDFGGGAITGFVIWMILVGLLSAGASDIQDDAANDVLPALAAGAAPLWIIIAVRGLVHGVTGAVYGLLLGGIATLFVGSAGIPCGSGMAAIVTAMMLAYAAGLLVTGAALMAPRTRAISALGGFLLLPVLVLGLGSRSMDIAGSGQCGSTGSAAAIGFLVAAASIVTSLALLRRMVTKAHRNGCLATA